MGGDGENGLAMAIFIAIAVMVAIGFALFFAIGLAVARRSRRGRPMLIAMLCGLAGIGVAGCVVAATFFESSWSPPPTIRFDVPPGFRQPWVILLEDPSARRALDWQGHRVPFLGVATTVAMPMGGVVRVRSLGDLPSGGDTRIVWSDGASAVGFTGGSAPAGLRAKRFVAYERQLGASVNNDVLPDGEALAADVRQRER